MLPKRHLTYSNVAATLALVIAVGGGTGIAVAAGLAKNSVGSPTFNRSMVGCTSLAQMSRPEVDLPAFGFAATAPRGDAAGSILVVTASAAGSSADRPFSLLVVC